MGKNFRKVLVASVALGAFAPSIAAAEGLTGVTVLASNTFAGAPTEGAEMDVGIFGMKNNVFAEIGEGVELPAFIGLYDVDFGDNTLAFT